MASLSSAKSSWRRSRGEVEGAYGPRTRWALSRSELREEGLKGVVGRERGDLDLARRRAEGGSAIGVDEAIGSGITIAVVTAMFWFVYNLWCLEG